MITKKETARKRVQRKNREAFDQIEKNRYEIDLKGDPNVNKIIKYLVAQKRCDILL